MKISRQTREIINIIVFVVVVAVLIITYVAYPLNRTKAMMGRPNVDDYDADSVIVNNDSLWINAGFAPDTFRVESDGLTTLACLQIWPDSGLFDTIAGTVMLLHAEGHDRDSMLSLARYLTDSGFSVIAYDQRACGRSSGKYRGEGQLEANDAIVMVPYLELRGRIAPPLAIVGFSYGGDAAMLAAQEDRRIDRVAAIEPFVTTRRMQDMQKIEYDTYWFPFYRTLMWWWYNIRSSYAEEYRDVEHIEGVAGRTLALIPTDLQADREVTTLIEQSDAALLTVKALPVDQDALFAEILAFLRAE